jgi:hypothetical protein
MTDPDEFGKRLLEAAEAAAAFGRWLEEIGEVSDKALRNIGLVPDSDIRREAARGMEAMKAWLANQDTTIGGDDDDE